MGVFRDIERRVRAVVDKAIDDREPWITWLEVAERASVDPEDVLVVLDRLANDPTSGVVRKPPKGRWATPPAPPDPSPP